LGAAAYAAKAAGLAATNRPESVNEEINWQLGNLSAPARVALRQLPPLGENRSEEFTHFRFGQPVFKVKGKPFAGGGGRTGETTAVFSVRQDEAATAVADDPATYEEVWRPGPRKSLVGLRVDLANVSQERVQELVEHAWRNTAPKRAVSAYDAQRNDSRS
jgi:hypothetical protein